MIDLRRGGTGLASSNDPRGAMLLAPKGRSGAPIATFGPLDQHPATCGSGSWAGQPQPTCRGLQSGIPTAS